MATPGGSGPLIIQQQQQSQQTQQTLQKAMVQQIQDLLKQQHRQQGGATIQQVIAGTPQQQSSGATVIGTQIMSSQQVAAAKASVPVATASSVLSQQVNTARSVTPIMVTAVPSGGNSLATVITTQAMMAGTVNITLAAPSGGGDTATLLKDVQQEVLVSPQKGLAVVGGITKTLHAVPQQQAVTVRHISGASLAQGPVAATAQALTPQHTIIKQQALAAAGKQSTIVGGQQVALRQAVGVQPSQQQLAAAIVRQHGISVQQPQTVTVHQSPGGATTRPVSIAVQQGLRPGVTVRQAVATPSVVSVQQSAVRPAGAATVQHVQTVPVRPPHTVTIQKSQTAAMQQVLQEVQQQAQAQAQQRHQVSSASVTSVSSATATVVTQATLPQSPTVVTVSQSSTESTADSNAAATTTAQNKSYAMRLRNQRS